MNNDAPIYPEAPFRVFSFGGGVQSHAVLLLQIQGKLDLPYDAFVFANVGKDSENPDTLAYIEEITKPLCAQHGIQFVEVQRTMRIAGQNKTVTLYEEIFRQRRSIIIPAHFGNKKGFGNRNCTTDFKIRVVDKWLRQQGHPANVIGLGISTDEWTRMRDTHWHDKETDSDKARPLGFWKKREYPLIERRMNRQDCINLFENTGMPVPPKSSCYWCPFKKRAEWIELRRKRPDLFAKAVEIEKHINQLRLDIGRDGMFLHSSLKPLEDAVAEQQGLFDALEEACDSGYCWT